MSPFTQYFIRKLLRRYFAQPRSLKPYFKVVDPAQADLSQVLRSLCPNEQSFQILLYELESLIEAHSRLESSQSSYEPTLVNAELASIEAKIHHLLGLRLGNLLPERLPRLLSEAEGQSFQFCVGRHLQSGICYRDHFYGLLERWPLDQQLEMYQIAWTLAQRQITCVMTRSEQQYSLWINLKVPTALVLLQRGPAILPSLLKLGPVIQRYQDLTAD